MTRQVLPLAIAALLLTTATACGESDGGKDGGDDGAGSDDGGGDDGGGDGGGGDTWRAGGLGSAYFVDGTTDGSLFHLEVQAVPDPREGEAYYGWLVEPGGQSIALGEIAVSGGEVVFETDVGLNALLDGYTTFQAYAGGADANVSGDPLWVGSVDPDLEDAYQQLLVSTEEVPGEEGSIRATQTTIEAALALAQDTADNVTDLPTMQRRAEQISNALTGEGSDLVADGNVETIADTHPVLGEGGGADLVLRDLDQASASVEPRHPVKDLANWSYDCTQEVQRHAEDAHEIADIVTASASIDAGRTRLLEVVQILEYAIDGEDQNDDGTVDPISEGALTCALDYVNQMAFLEVVTAGATE